MKKIVIIPDKFKGSFTSVEIATMMSEAVRSVLPDAVIVTIPVSDGGDGFVECFLTAFGGEWVVTDSLDPFDRPIKSFFGMLDSKTAVIELAASAGLSLVKDCPNPGLASTYGVGELILKAADRDVKSILIGLGGSATNDAGCGMLVALGVRFYDKNGIMFLPTGLTLGRIASIDIHSLDERLKSIQFQTLCDVTNPLHGRNGAAFIFAGQKGADAEMIDRLDQNLQSYARLLYDTYGLSTDFPGAGAAGGTAVALKLFLHSSIESGIDLLLQKIKFDSIIQDADMILTGEGQLDRQSFRGKVISGIAKHAAKYGVPLYAIAGRLTGIDETCFPRGLTGACGLSDPSVSLAEAISNTPIKIDIAIQRILRGDLPDKVWTESK